MKTTDILSAVIAVVGVILIPLLVLLVRIVIRQANVEAVVTTAVNDFRETTKEMYSSMREDRQSTNRRLTWLEQNLYRRGRDKDAL